MSDISKEMISEYVENRIIELRKIIAEDDFTFPARVEELIHLDKHFTGEKDG